MSKDFVTAGLRSATGTSKAKLPRCECGRFLSLSAERRRGYCVECCQHGPLSEGRCTSYPDACPGRS